MSHNIYFPGCLPLRCCRLFAGCRGYVCITAKEIDGAVVGLGVFNNALYILLRRNIGLHCYTAAAFGGSLCVVEVYINSNNLLRALTHKAVGKFATNATTRASNYNSFID